MHVPRQGGKISILLFVLYFKLFSEPFFDCYLWLLGASPPDTGVMPLDPGGGLPSLRLLSVTPTLTKSWLRD